MRKNRSQSDSIFRCVGRMVIAWNDLELQIRRVLFAITDTHEHFLSVATLTADMQAEALFKALKSVAKEHDRFHAKFNRFLVVISEKTGRTPTQIGPISEHIENLYTCADRLRLYRNYYAHGITSPAGKITYTLGSMTARKGLSLHDHPIKLRDITKTTAAITQTVKYGRRIEQCLRTRQSRATKPIQWPPKVRPLPELKKAYTSLTDQLPIL